MTCTCLTRDLHLLTGDLHLLDSPCCVGQEHDPQLLHPLTPYQSRETHPLESQHASARLMTCICLTPLAV